MSNNKINGDRKPVLGRGYLDIPRAHLTYIPTIHFLLNTLCMKLFLKTTTRIIRYNSECNEIRSVY